MSGLYSPITMSFIILAAIMFVVEHRFCTAFSSPNLLHINKNDAPSTSITHQRYHRKDNVYSSSSFILPTSISLSIRLKMVENDGHSHDHSVSTKLIVIWWLCQVYLSVICVISNHIVFAIYNLEQITAQSFKRSRWNIRFEKEWTQSWIHINLTPSYKYHYYYYFSHFRWPRRR